MDNNKFKGYTYPITKDAKGYFHSQSDIDQIKSDLFVLLMTNPGERIMLPLYGAGLRSLIYEQNDTDLRIKVRDLIIKAITDWEPRITVEQVEVLASVDPYSLDRYDDRNQDENILMVRISFFDPQNIQNVQELNLTVPLGGAN